MTLFESTIYRSVSSKPSTIKIHKPGLRRLHQQNLILNAAKFSLCTKSSISASLPPSQFSPWLVSLAYPLVRYGVIPAYFGKIEVTGQSNLPLSGPVILAPTHRSRWDSVLVPYAAGHDVTGRHLRFMVTADEVVGFQGWFIRHLGGFPVDTNRPAIASLRHGVDLLRKRETLVIFPEGDIFRGDQTHCLKPGLARLALQAEISLPNLGVQVVPISIHYSQPQVPWKCDVKVQIGSPLRVAEYNLGSPKCASQKLTVDLYQSLEKMTAEYLG